jgi:hypothetical protein
MGKSAKVKEAQRRTQRRRYALDTTKGEIKPKQEPTTSPEAESTPQPASFRAAEVTDD